MKQKWLLIALTIPVAVIVILIGYTTWRRVQLGKVEVTTIYFDAFYEPSLSEVISTCEMNGELCSYLYHDKVRYRRGGQFNEKFPENETIEKYTQIGCDLLNLKSCAALGEHYLETKESQKAWLPLAKSCFGGNESNACRALERNGMTVPPVLAPPNGTFLELQGAKWVEENPTDRTLIQAQEQLKPCYTERGDDKGVVGIELVIAGAKAAVSLRSSTMDKKLTDCLVQQIGTLTFAPEIKTTLWRRLLFSDRH